MLHTDLLTQKPRCDILFVHNAVFFDDVMLTKNVRLFKSCFCFMLILQQVDFGNWPPMIHPADALRISDRRWAIVQEVQRTQQR